MLRTFVFSALLILLNLSLSACSSQPLNKPSELIDTTPVWYQKRLLKTFNYEYIGYGQGTTEQAAKAQAQAELAQNIETNIQVIVKNNALIKNDNSSKNAIVASKAISNLRLSDLKRVKVEQVDGQFFVAYKYSNLPVALKIASSNIKLKCTTHSHPYLSQTPLWHDIANNLPCMPAFEVIYKNNTWYLLSGKAMFSFSLDDFKLLFASSKDPALDMQLSKRRLQQGELYHIKLKSHQKAYLSLVQIFDSGQMHLLIDNALVKPKQKITFPDLNLYDGLVAQANKANGISKDLTLAVLCDKPNKLASIASVTEQALAADNKQMFTLIMQQIKDCKVSSDILRIQGGSF